MNILSAIHPTVRQIGLTIVLFIIAVKVLNYKKSYYIA